MSNQVTIQRTIFHDTDSTGKVIETTYGYRIYDDYAAAYDNNFSSLEELGKLSPEDLIDRARGLSDAANDMIQFAIENNKPVVVDDQEVYVGGAPKP